MFIMRDGGLSIACPGMRHEPQPMGKVTTMLTPIIALDSLPLLSQMPAAHGALLSPVQLSGQTIFDVVVAIIVISH